jgi:murein DD-endopeptidase MepM/ murein hydrolase activator NlpD
MFRIENPRAIRTVTSALLLVAVLCAAFALNRTEGSIASVSRPGAVPASVKSGGLVVPGRPSITDVVCIRQCVAPRMATPGATVRVVGEYLNRVRHIVFVGRSGPVKARYSTRNFQAVSAVVPNQADDGRPFVISTSGFRSNRAPRDLEILPVSRIPTEVFPVRGSHNFGSSGARFGAPRGGYAHQGQDVMASCGTRLVSIRRARVLYRDYHSAAGNYVVLKNLGSNTQFAYMHLLRPSSLKPGMLVGAGQPIGLVGQTGRAYGCHLHFEYWVGSWQTGGRPVDPLRYLYSLR